MENSRRESKGEGEKKRGRDEGGSFMEDGGGGRGNEAEKKSNLGREVTWKRIVMGRRGEGQRGGGVKDRERERERNEVEVMGDKRERKQQQAGMGKREAKKEVESKGTDME